MMANNRKIAISTSNMDGEEVICYQTTLDAHRAKHTEPFSDDDVVENVSRPDVVAKSGHEIPGHEDRLLYYKEKQFEDAPRMMKTVVDHSKTPAVITSMFRTSKFTQDGAIVYTRPGYLEEKLNAKRSSGHE